MPKLDRKNQLIFAGQVAPTNVVAQFGSLAAGAKSYSNDVDAITALPAWGTGWLTALINGSAPAMQDRNAIDYVTTYQLAYLMEQGIPDYKADQVYYTGSHCKDETTGIIYASKTDDNDGNALSDETNWEPVPAGGRGSIPLGSVIAVVDDYSNVSLPASGSIDAQGFQLCDGAALAGDATIGTGVNLGSATPDLTDGRFLRGTTESGTFAGAAKKAIPFNAMPSHAHTMNHNHASFVTSSGGTHGHTSAVNLWSPVGGSVNGSAKAAAAPTDAVAIGSTSVSVGGTHQHTIDVPNYTGNTGNTGGSDLFNVEPAFMNVKYLIRVK